VRKTKCQICGKPIEGYPLYFTEIGKTKVWGIPMDVRVFIVCPKCYEMLDLKKKGLMKCNYCNTIYPIGEKCPECGARK